MKELREIVMIVFACGIPISCFVGATILAYHKRKGWGWLIFAGVLIASGIHLKFD